MATVTGLPLIPKFKTKHYPVTLPTELGVRLTAPIKGTGGWQDLLSAIQSQVISNTVHDNETDETVTMYTLDLPEGLMHRMIPYAVKFGAGGYQSMIRWILCLVLQQHETAILGTPGSLKDKV